MTIESEKNLRRRSREAEPTRESKEGEVDEELKKAAAMERADYLAREVKQSKKQMQNILLHMQEVLSAIRELRKQLQIGENGDPASVAEDKKRIQALEKKIDAYGMELENMREDLIREQIEELREQSGGASELFRTRAEEMVDTMIQGIRN